MKKLAVVVPFFKRHELTNLCFENLSIQQKKYKFDVFACGDNDELVSSYGFTNVNHPNLPLSKKNNALVKDTVGKGYDGVVLIGSDDFISDSVFDRYMKLDYSKPIMYGFDSVYFYDVSLKKAGLFKAEYTYTIGAGRLFTSNLIDKLNGNLWTGNSNSGLDRNCSLNILQAGCEEIKLISNEEIILDVKHCFNITSPDILKKCHEINIEKILNQIHVGEKIINLAPTISLPRKISYSKPMEKIKIKFLKSVAGITEGEVKSVEKKHAVQLVNSGKAVYFEGEYITKKIEISEPIKEDVKDCKDCPDCADCAETTNVPETKKRGRKK